MVSSNPDGGSGSASSWFDDNAELIQFVGIALFIFAVLQLIYFELYLGSPVFKAYLVLCAKLSAGLLLAVGEEVTRFEQTITSIHGPAVTVVEGCDALRIFSVLVAAIAAFNASIRDKVLGILCGLTFMFVINLFRISALLWFDVHLTEWFDFMHQTGLPLMLWAIAMLYFFLWGTIALRRQSQ